MIKINNLSKTIRNKAILKGIDAELTGITGIIGPNGAGKTTFMEIIANVQKGDSSTTISYSEKEGNTERKIGYLPQNFNLYPNLTVYQALKLIAALKDSLDEFYIEQLLKQMNLEQYRNQKLKTLSGGTLQRVGIAQAILNKPDYLIIDEPTTGLDIIESIKLRKSLLNIKNDVQIIISSHIPEDITFICDHLLVLNKGKKIFEGSLEQLITQSDNVTYEGVINSSEIESVNYLGKIINVEQKANGQVKVRFIAKTLINNPLFNMVESDFTSSYISLLEGVGE